MNATDTVFVVCDASGEYVADDSGESRTPAAGEATEFVTRAEAEAACTRVTDRVLIREV